MSEQNPRDYSEIMRSPYDEGPRDRREGESEIGWKVPVFAAALGALVAGAFVIYGVVAGPDDTDAAATTSSTSTTTTLLEPVKDLGLPEGYVAVNEEVGMRGEVLHGGESTWAAVSTATVGALAAPLVPPVEIGRWVLSSVGNDYPAFRQLNENGALGNVSIEFGDLPELPSATLRAWPAIGEFTREVTIDLPGTEIPREIVAERIDMGGGGVIVIDRLVIGDGWGHIQWRTVGFTPAKVAVVAEFTGTDDPGTPDEVDPTIIASPHLVRMRQGTGVIPLPPLYGSFGSSQLVRSGEPLSNANPHTGLIVTITVTVPEDLGEPIELPITVGS